ncbi:alanine racemase [Metallumcola ferriviriculae]|uniref:Alanine racemase n=1 Tax=Metallumcola ferriviriculae TaxID=3039180 RepID=A0AAU0UK13_9FIRM|nr:alanine racemase [Desulfitibacteraceae bacterium MK1]
MSAETPYLALDKDKLKANIKDMALFSEKEGVVLRPHVKAHKLRPIADMQMRAGAVGLTVSKLAEMEVFLSGGIKNIFLAYQLVSRQKIQRMLEITYDAMIRVAIDNPIHIDILSEIANQRHRQVEVLVEVDTGLQRCGVATAEEALGLVKLIKQRDGVLFKGIMTHAGHVYAARSYEQVLQIGEQEGKTMVELADYLDSKGYCSDVISVGSTPTAKISGSIDGVTEIRPGNYVFYDAMQVGLGVVPPERCALIVCATVISRAHNDRRLVIDAGSKTLALDKGAHGVEQVKGFGIIKGFPHLLLERLSEEHGIISVLSDGDIPQVGDQLEIIPNHACPVINLADRVFIKEKGRVKESWVIDARGKVQ